MFKYYDWFFELNRKLTRASSLRDISNTNLQNAFLLMHHPRNKLVKKQPWKGYVYTKDGKKLDGLTEPLKRLFYPYHLNAVTGGAKTGGSSRGNRTDKELAGLINEGKLPISEDGSFSTYTERVLAYLHKHNLQPFMAQHLVFDENLNIATELDLVCVYQKFNRPNDKNVVNVQIKTGFDKNYEVTSGHLCSPYVCNSKITRIKKSYETTHQLQNLVEHMMVTKNYDDLLLESVVLVVSEEVTSKYRISDHIFGVKDDVYENLKQRLVNDELELDINNIKTAAAMKKAKNMFY
jgi:hypothetical protein